MNVTRFSTNYSWQKVFAGLVALQTGLKTVIEAIDAKLYARGYVYLPFTIPATELAAGTPIQVVSPVIGMIKTIQTIVQTDIVTGGVIPAKIGTTDVPGLSITIANSANAGSVVSDDATEHSDSIVAVGSRIQIIPSAAFNGGGAISGMIKIQIE